MAEATKLHGVQHCSNLLGRGLLLLLLLLLRWLLSSKLSQLGSCNRGLLLPVVLLLPLGRTLLVLTKPLARLRVCRP
jgi:hypothetical protein